MTPKQAAAVLAEESLMATPTELSNDDGGPYVSLSIDRRLNGADEVIGNGCIDGDVTRDLLEAMVVWFDHPNEVAEAQVAALAERVSKA